MQRAQTMDEWKQQMAEYVSRRDAAMAEVNVQVGDKVQYHKVSPWGSAEVFSGILYIANNGQPKVKLDRESIAKAEGRKSMAWNKGWTK